MFCIQNTLSIVRGQGGAGLTSDSILYCGAGWSYPPFCNWTLALTQPIRVSQSSDITTPIKPLDLLKPVFFHHANVSVSGTEPMLAWNSGFLQLHQTRLPGGPWGSQNLGVTVHLPDVYSRKNCFKQFAAVREAAKSSLKFRWLKGQGGANS